MLAEATTLIREGGSLGQRGHDAKWALVRPVGEGGVASVYEAVQVNGLRVAIKRLHPSLLRDRQVVPRFLREAALANRVPHPAIVRVLDDGIDQEGCPFLVLEWVDGQSLEDKRVASGGVLPPATVIEWGVELLSALSAAHRAGVLHRDIKPGNLMVDAWGRLRVLDFGLARALQDESAADALTSVDTVLGTVGFMSPEQASGRWDIVDERSDLWSVGATLWKLATGHEVHEAETKLSRLASAAITPVKDLASRAPHLGRAQLQFFERALAFAQRDRFQSADDMCRALQALREDAHRQATEPSRRGLSRKLVPLGAVACALSAILAISASHASAPPPQVIRTPLGLGSMASVYAPVSIAVVAPPSSLSASPPKEAPRTRESRVTAVDPLNRRH